MANITVSNDIDTFLQAANNAAAKSALGISDSNWENVSTNAVELRDGTTATEGYLYNTYTDASNYERGFLKWDTNEFVIGTEALGTGTARNLRLVTNNLLKVGTSSDDDQFLSISNSNYGDIRIGPVNPSSNGGGAVIIGSGAYVNTRGNGKSIAIGRESTADSYGAIAIGSDTTRAMAANSIAIGDTANASGAGSVALGSAGKWGGSYAKRAAEISFPRFYGHSQHGFNYLNATTTDGNPVDFYTMSSTFFVDSNTAMCIKGQVIAKKTDHSLVEKWDVEATFLNDGTTLTMVSSSIDLKTPNTSGWTLVIAADNVNKTIKLTITAEATVKATASLHYIDQT